MHDTGRCRSAPISQPTLRGVAAVDRRGGREAEIKLEAFVICSKSFPLITISVHRNPVASTQQRIYSKKINKRKN